MVKLNGERTTRLRPIEGEYIRFNPFEELTAMEQRMEDLFGPRFKSGPLEWAILDEPYPYEPAVDIIQTEGYIEMFVALPGFPMEAIQVDAAPDTITIVGDREPLYPEDVVVHTQEWGVTPVKFRANYILPTEVDPRHVKATFRNGVLHLQLPISETARVKTVPVKVVPA
ncbi:MAG TPA: Hsp20/alpha crystallin family protein [Chthonomonadaceae bacterium]|nr:Hsp20/alpha crystallin family protein [Chthonomonadaceae bacterium]